MPASELRTDQVVLRFYEELNEHLSPDRRKVSFSYPMRPGTTVGEVLDELGVPRGEVDLVIVDGYSADFESVLADGERVACYPVFETFEVRPLVQARPRPLRRTRFLVGPGLEGLLRGLRGRGFDSRDGGGMGGEELAGRADREERVLLVCEPGAAAAEPPARCHRVRGTVPEVQLREVLERFQLVGLRLSPRCRECNRPLDEGRAEPVCRRCAEG
jgi:uncharacterized protein with PIN domain